MDTGLLIWQYLQIGFTHVLPLGFDHLLFILTLFFMPAGFRSIVIACSVFTLAHSLSLALASSGLVLPQASIIEPLIACSIIVSALGNILSKGDGKWRYPLVGCFGLIHGLGFASALRDAGLPSKGFITALISFNVGVEIAQISVLLIAYVLITIPFGAKTWYKTRLAYPSCAIIASVGMYWLIQRTVA